MKKILIFSSVYEPGIKGGGPIRSIKNIVNEMSDKYEFNIITLDRDVGDVTPYNGIETSKWLTDGNTKVYYANKSDLTLRNIRHLIRQSKCDYIYLNSFFSIKFSFYVILLKRLKQIDKKIILAPRGEFSPGAINLKKIKKKLFIDVSKYFLLHHKIYWHATNELEQEHIQQWMNSGSGIFVASNYIEMPPFQQNKIPKEVGEVNLVFISRISEKKNLDGALDLLLNNKFDGKINFNIYGPIEDSNYWNKCKSKIKLLPNNIHVKYHGVLERKDIKKVYSNNHFLFFLTHGENFGHVIVESLMSGTPVILSDQTPWIDLENKGVGWDLSLNEKEKINATINYCIELNNEEYLDMSGKSRQYIEEQFDVVNLNKRYEEMFS